MNKVIIVNLGGTAWQLEETGYDALRHYLDTAAQRLQGNPDREEILSDIECSIAEKFRPLVNNTKNVVLAREVTRVLEEMGPIEAATGSAPAGAEGAGATSGTGAPPPPPPPFTGGLPRRLYRISEGAMFAGVCNGLAVYANLDPTLVRLAFAGLMFFWGTGFLVYVILALVVPEASSPAEKAAASGMPATAEEFIRRAREGYYDTLKRFGDRQARRAWKRRFKWQMRVNAAHWDFNWQNYWARQIPYHPVVCVILPCVSLLLGALTILWLSALVSLIGSGAVLGHPLPASVPVWAAALGVFILYGLVAGPLKMARHLCYWSVGRSGRAAACVGFAEALIGLAVAVAVIWLAIDYLPEVETAIKSLPALVHQAEGDITTWWHSH